MKFTLTRNSTGPDGTFGTLTWGEDSLVTLELPWNDGDNHPDKSCILPGVYDLTVDASPHLEEPTPRLLSVPGRTSIRIHQGNFTANTLGCILVGENEARFGSEEGITNSRVALHQVMAAINGDMETSTIEIKNGWEAAA